MRTLLPRASGILLIFAALLGVILSIVGLVAVWRTEGQVVAALQDGADLSLRTADATAEMLQVADVTFSQLDSSLVQMELLAQHLDTALDTTSDIAQSVGDLAGDDFITVVRDTQRSLGTVQASAKLIDDTLRLITAIPFLGTRYQPDVPLQTSVAEVSHSLDKIPATLRQVQVGMNSTVDASKSLQSDVQALSANVTEIRTNLNRAQTVIGQYQTIVAELQTAAQRARSRAVLWGSRFAWAISAFLIWLLVSQLGVLLNGAALLRVAARKQVALDIEAAQEETKRLP